MGKFEVEQKYFVIKIEQFKQLSEEDQDNFLNILEKIGSNNFYYVVNTDEPYAEQVLKLIQEGELAKETANDNTVG